MCFVRRALMGDQFLLTPKESQSAGSLFPVRPMGRVEPDQTLRMFCILALLYVVSA